MKVDKVMRTGVQTCQPGDSLNTAAKIMWENDCGSVPVVSDGVVAGMITDRDVCMAAYLQGRALWDIDVASAMSRGVHVCAANDTVLQAQKTMRANKVRRLPVVDADGALVGIVSLSDIVAAAEKTPERSRKGAQVAVAETLCAITDRHAEASDAATS